MIVIIIFAGVRQAPQTGDKFSRGAAHPLSHAQRAVRLRTGGGIYDSFVTVF